MKKKSQSQRKTVSRTLYERNNQKNKYSYINTFRQTKDSKYFSSKDDIKKKLISNQDSPRTIDYMQVMQKYEHLIEQNSENKKGEKENYFETEINSYIKNNNNNDINNLINFCRTDDNNEKLNKKKEINNVIYLDYEKGKNKSYKNIRNIFNDKIKLDRNKINDFFVDKNEEDKRNSATFKLTSRKNIAYNSQSFNNLNNTNNNQNNFYKKYNNNKSFSFFHDILNNKNMNNIKSNEININNNNNVFIEKVKPIISLCQKYAKIMINSINFIEVNSVNNSNDVLLELKNIIKQYNKFIFSDKIKNFISQEDFSKNNFLLENAKNIYNFNFKEFEPKNLNFTEKFRNKISALKNEKCKIYDELNTYKKKNKFLSLEKDEMDIIINKLKKENEVLKIKIKSLENIENQYNIQSNENNKLKGQIENLNIDIKYKENIINNLQQILEQIKFNSNLLNNNYQRNTNTKDDFHIENDKQNNESGFLSDINNESIEKDIIAPNNLNVNSIIENLLNIDEDKNKNTTKNIKFNNNEDEQKNITKKMEKIDQDILDLKTKLKIIYSK